MVLSKEKLVIMQNFVQRQPLLLCFTLIFVEARLIAKAIQIETNYSQKMINL